MDNEFTPGPWHVFAPESHSPGIEAANSPRPTIVVFGNADEQTGIKGADRETTLANARLIAASPALFEALNGFVEFDRENTLTDEYQNIGDNYPPDTWKSSELSRLFENARNAIDKALNG